MLVDGSGQLKLTKVSLDLALKNLTWVANQLSQDGKVLLSEMQIQVRGFSFPNGQSTPGAQLTDLFHRTLQQL